MSLQAGEIGGIMHVDFLIERLWSFVCFHVTFLDKDVRVKQPIFGKF